MEKPNALATVPDDELLRRLVGLLHQSRHTEVDLVAHIGEVDARHLYAREASPSMHAYCTAVLHLSEAEAYLRIAAARASREHPVLLEMLADGRLHLTAVAKLAPHLSVENREALLKRATHRSKRQVQELLAEIAPRPDVPATVRKLPERRPALTTLGPDPGAAATGSGADGAHAVELRLDAVDGPGGEPRADREAAPRRGIESGCPRLRPDAVAGPLAAGRGGIPTRPEVLEPLAPGRYRIQFTASAGLRDKLERLRALMRSSVPDGDLAAVIERAVTEKLERLEARRFGLRKVQVGREPVSASPTSSGGPRSAHGSTSQDGSATADGAAAADGPPANGASAPGAPASGSPPTDASATGSPASGSPATGSPAAGRSPSVRIRGSVTRHVPAAVRRAVYERDGGRCAYADAGGRRCTAREGLEYHHRHPFGLGGDHSVRAVGLLCKSHNLYLAEGDYGREAVARHRRARKPGSRSSAAK